MKERVMKVDTETIVPIWLFFLFFVSPIVLLMKKTMERRGKRYPPGPFRLPFIGNIHQLGTSPHQSFSQLSKIYGPVMLLKLGNVPTLVISSAEAAREVLITHDLECCSRPPLMSAGKLSYNYLDLAFGPYSDYLREVRKICVLKLFSAKRVKLYQPVREEEVSSLINSVSRCASTCQSVDLTQKLYALTANITFKIAFGKSFEESSMDNGRFQELLHDTENLLASFTATDFFPYVGWCVDRLTGLKERLEHVSHELDSFFQEVIDDHLKLDRHREDQEDIVDVLLRVEKESIESGQTWFTKNHIKAILMNIFLGGVDTGAITMVWALTELARNPEAMKKVQDEIRSCIGNKGNVAEEDLDKLSYFKMVLKETMRLHPAAPLLLPRETGSSTKILNYDIDPKTRIHVNVWAIGRDPILWKNPEEFIPERFMDTSIEYRGQHFELLPFGAGRRICPGITMGMATVELALANLLYHFDWKLPDGMNKEDISIEEGFGLATCKKLALELVPSKYQWPI